MLIRYATPADAAAIARIQVDTWRTTYRGIVPDSYLDRMDYDLQSQRIDGFFGDTNPGTFGFVAETPDNGLIGFAFGGPERSGDLIYRGEMSAIYVLADYQSRGAGRRLTAAVAERLLEMGLPSMLVWVLSQNRFRGFYEALGGVAVRTGSITINGVDIEETAYGWIDVSKLCLK